MGKSSNSSDAIKEPLIEKHHEEKKLFCCQGAMIDVTET